jgi:hypothetical protein
MGGTADLDARTQICMAATGKLAAELQMVDEEAFLHRNKGDVRLLGKSGVSASIKRGLKGSSSTPFRPPSLQIED